MRAAAFVLLVACSGPPAAGTDAGAPDAAVVVADAAPVDAPPADAPVLDAALDAAPDAGAAAADAGPDHNPHDIRFTEVTGTWPGAFPGGRTDPDPWGVGSGAALGDLDGDGDLDIVLARCDTPNGGPSVILRQVGPDLEFPLFAIDAGFTALVEGTCAHAAALGDYDRDGDLDLFLAMNDGDLLLRNDGAGGFTDVTAIAGVAGPTGAPEPGSTVQTADSDLSTGAVWADLNRDGLLDLYVVQHTVVLPPADHEMLRNRLYLNRGDGTFADVSAAAGVEGYGSSQAALIADLDNDGDLEIYVANDRFAINGSGGNPELQPDAWLDPIDFDQHGVPTYVDRAASYGVDGPRSSMGIALTDLNGDGVDDLYVTDWGPNHLQVWMPAEGMYADVAYDWDLALKRNALNYYTVSWGARFVDLDRDGEVELFLVNGGVTDPVNCQGWSQLDLLLRRRDDANLFADITGAAGLPDAYDCPPTSGEPSAGRGAVFGDLDGDGDDDVIVTPYVETYRVYRNDTPQTGRHRVRVAPVGTVSAPTPIGLVLEVQRLDGTIVRRTLYGGGDTMSQSQAVLEAGIGADSAVLNATLEWPSGYRMRLDLWSGFVLDNTMTVVEPPWLTLSARVAGASDPAPVLTYQPADETGVFVGAAAAGRTVTVTRSDGVAAPVTDHGDGTYSAALPHPGSARVTVLTVSDGAVTHRIRPAITYQ